LNYTLYEGNDSFLAGPTEATSKLWEQVMQLSKEERERGGMWEMEQTRRCKRVYPIKLHSL
ncbi:hypothetical protein I6D97_02010, partial [Staphylococcus aureus]|nr:hypothetical protein [Staphylococcus aureus]